MKITDLRIHSVAFPDPPIRNSWGVHAPYALRTIIEVESDEGLIGLGETYGGETIRTHLEAAGQSLIGMDIQHLPAIADLFTNRKAYVAIETACLDITGQATGKKVCDLLGGRMRDSVPFSAYLFFKYENDEIHGDFVSGRVMTPDAMLDEARAFFEMGGFTSVKMKGGILEPEEEVECLRLIANEFGDSIGLRLDPNCIWPMDKAVAVARAMESLNTEYLEDPVYGLDQMAALKQQTSLLLGTNSCVVAFDHIAPAVQKQAVDVVLSDHHYWGGMFDNRYLSKICHTFGLGISMHSTSHLGISMAAMIHSAATFDVVDYACDTHYPWVVDDVIIGDKLPINNGHMQVPEGFGLGVALDHSKLEILKDNYRKFGQQERDDIGELKRRDPDWQTRMPEWMAQIDPAKFI